MFENRLPADQIDALAVGNTVLIEEWRWRKASYYSATVTRLTATQIVVTRPTASGGGTYEERFRKKDAALVGNAAVRSELVDPVHPRTVAGRAESQRKRRQQDIDSLAHRWSRSPDDLTLLRQLHAAIGEYLEAADGQPT